MEYANFMAIVYNLVHEFKVPRLTSQIQKQFDNLKAKGFRLLLNLSRVPFIISPTFLFVCLYVRSIHSPR